MVFNEFKIRKVKKTTGVTPWNPLWNLVKTRGLRPIPQGRPKAYSTGFTLLEMMVSVSIFTIVMTISVGAILTLNDSLQKAKLMRAAVENVSFALEGMAKKIRTGTLIICRQDPENGFSYPMKLPQDCPTGGKKISFYYPQENRFVSYQYRAADSTNTSRIEISTMSFDGQFVTLDSLTGNDITIKDLTFYVTGACAINNSSVPSPGVIPYCTSSDYRQPLIKITLTGKAKIGKTRFDTTFNLQTTVSTRILDNG